VTPLCVALVVLAAMLGACLGVVMFAACALSGRTDEDHGLDQ
jgi:hypothetical protein